MFYCWVTASCCSNYDVSKREGDVLYKLWQHLRREVGVDVQGDRTQDWLVIVASFNHNHSITLTVSLIVTMITKVPILTEILIFL